MIPTLTTKESLLFYLTLTSGCGLFIFIFRLNIQPFVPARTVLEHLVSEDFCENEKPLKHEVRDAKVKEQSAYAGFQSRRSNTPTSSVLHISNNAVLV